MFVGEVVSELWPPPPPSLLPDGLEEMPPGPELAGVLAGIDLDSLPGFDLVVVMAAQARMVSYHQAGLLDLVARVADATTEASVWFPTTTGSSPPTRSALLSVSPGGRRVLLLELALELRRLPQLAEALRSGLIDLPRARVVCAELATLADGEAQQVVSVVLERASTQTTGQLAARVRRLVLSVDPAAAEERYERGIEGRRVELSANPDGTANLIAWSLPRRAGQRRLRPPRPPRPSGQGSRRPPQHRPGTSRRPLGPGRLWGRLGAARGHRPAGRPGHPHRVGGASGGDTGVRAGGRRRRPPGGRHPGGFGVAGGGHPPRQRSGALGRDHQTETHHRATPLCGGPFPHLCVPRVPHAGQPAPTSTTGSTTPRGDRPWSNTSTRCAATTTGSKTPDGNCNPDPTAPPPGPVPSDTPTPPDPTHPEHGHTPHRSAEPARVLAPAAAGLPCPPHVFWR